jgi:hypothetical protein
LQLALDTVTVNGENYGVPTASSWRAGGDHKKRDFAWIGGSAGGGAVIGGPVGAGAGTAVAFLTGKKDIHLRSETRLTFKLPEPLTIPVEG